MKLTEFLADIGKPVAFYPGLAKALDDIKQAIFICQFFYWKDKGDDPEGWIYKTVDEIERETALSYKEQLRVRSGMIKKGLLEEQYARTEHMMYFRINWDAVNALWEEHMTKSNMPHMTKGKVAHDQRLTGILPKVSSLNGTTESTHQSTQEKKDAKKIFEMANKKMDAMLENEKKANGRSWTLMHEPFLAFGKEFCEATGMAYSKKVSMDWMSTFSDWMIARYSPDMISVAVREICSMPIPTPITRPGSITWKLADMKVKKFVSGNAPPSTVEYIPDDTPMIARPDFSKKAEVSA